MIQIITYDIKSFENIFNSEYKISKFDEVQAFDDFEIFIVDLSNANIWKYDGDGPTNVNCRKDLITLKEAISNSQKCKILIVFPQNLKFEYYYNYTYINGVRVKKYLKAISLKDNKDNLIKIINELLYSLAPIKLLFEKTNTKISATIIKSDFNFVLQEESYFDSITFSQNSNKITTIKKDRVIITTLDLLINKTSLECFINNYLKENTVMENIPEWINEFDILNEKEEKAEILKIKSLIEEYNNKKVEKEKILKDYLTIKSILYETDKNLQNQVSKMLCDIFNYSDPDFIDEGEEDFRIKLDDITFLIETKGLTKNLAGTDVSKLFNHVEVYLETADEKENVKGLLIVATERLKKPEERKQIPDRQILIARRNGLLIISTEVFLKIYEDFMNKKISQEEIKKCFIENVGNLNQL